MNTTENNKLIAEFMGLQKQPSNGYGYLDKNGNNYLTDKGVQYNSDWNWLMPVVEKIETAKNIFNDGSYLDFTIYSDAVSIEDSMGRQLILINKSEGIGELQKELILFESKIQAVYNAVVEFIKWYNLQTK